MQQSAGDELPTLDEIDAFLEVVGGGSFTSAAGKLKLPKSTLSRRVARLEGKLGVRLLSRTTRRLSLTDVGAAFHERASRARAELDEAAAAVRLERDQPLGHLRMTAPVDHAGEMAEVIDEYRRRHPQVSVELMLTDRLVDLVAEGIDIALRASRQLADSTLVARKVADIGMRLYASPRYLRARGRPRSIDELADHDAVALHGVNGRVTWVLEREGEVREVKMRAPVSGNDLGFVEEAALLGAGIAVLPSTWIEPEVRARRLVAILPEWSLGGSALYAVVPGGRLVSAKVRAMRELLAAHFERGKRRRERKR